MPMEHRQAREYRWASRAGKAASREHANGTIRYQNGTCSTRQPKDAQIFNTREMDEGLRIESMDDTLVDRTCLPGGRVVKDG